MLASGGTRGLTELFAHTLADAAQALMLCLLEKQEQVFLGGVLSGLGGRVGLEKGQGGRSLKLAKEGQRHGVIRFEAGGELVHQARLARNQAFLITRERFQLLDEGAIRPQTPQVSEVTAPASRQQIGIDGIRFGPSGFAMAIDRFGIDRVDRKAGRESKRR